MAKIIKVNGTTNEVTGKLTLEVMQEAVGGNIELVSLNDGRVMVVNEEGLLEQLPQNLRATAISGKLIVGNVLIAEESEID